MKIDNLFKILEGEESNLRLKELYQSDIDFQKERYKKVLSDFKNRYSYENVSLVCSSGRTELAGNHTDHNNGCVLAASINLDIIGAVAKTDDKIVEINSAGYPVSRVDLSNLDKVEEEEGTTQALIRGVAKRFSDLGFNIGGFVACSDSNIFRGAGLSSSAAIENFIGYVFSFLYNDEKVDKVEIAKVSQWAENNYFGKPCGLMDQVACIYGGIVSIDFKDSLNPIVNQVNYSFDSIGYSVFIINTGGSHEDLTDEYAAIPSEMKSVASLFGYKTLRGLELEDILPRAKEISEKCGDRALLRAIHFIEENKRPNKMVKYLKENEIKKYLKMVNKSGSSSWRLLQNYNTQQESKSQGISVAQTLSDIFFKAHKKEADFVGACRVHGGGFAGAVQVYVHSSLEKEYLAFMEQAFKKEDMNKLVIRDYGVTVVF